MTDCRWPEPFVARAWQNESVREVDARFPSGFWTGYWQQRGRRGRMEMGLTFAGGKLFGEGRDAVGDFAVSGGYDAERGHCAMLKTYLGQHDVHYDGRAAEKGIVGIWRIVYPDRTIDAGDFHIWPVGRGGTTHLREETSEPVAIEA